MKIAIPHKYFFSLLYQTYLCKWQNFLSSEIFQSWHSLDSFNSLHSSNFISQCSSDEHERQIRTCVWRVWMILRKGKKAQIGKKLTNFNKNIKLKKKCSQLVFQLLHQRVFKFYMRIFQKFFIFFLIKIQIFLLYRERGTEKRAQFWWCRIERWRYAILFSHRFFFSFLNWIIADPSPIARNDIFIDKHSLFYGKVFEAEGKTKNMNKFYFYGLRFFSLFCCLYHSVCMYSNHSFRVRRRKKKKRKKMGKSDPT